MRHEQWRPIPGWERYEVSDRGAVRSVRTGKRRKVRANNSGHLMLHLFDGSGGRAPVFVHRIMLMAFDRMPNSGEVTRHLNGDPTDNRLENLTWGSASDNMQDRLAHGRHHLAVKTHCPAGHSYAEHGVTYLRSNGYRERHCRECKRDRWITQRAQMATAS